MQRNTAQRLYVVAFNGAGRVSGEAANITCQYSIDGGAFGATSDTNPTEVGTSGVYYFELTAAETNGHAVTFIPSCSTAGVEVNPEPGFTIYTDSGNAATTVSASITGGINSGSRVEIYQDDDVEGDYKVRFSITDATKDFSGVTAALFAAGTVAGTPVVTGTCSVVTKDASGNLVVDVTISNTQAQADAGNYPYTLKVVIGTKRHTVNSGTLVVSPTYLSFR